MAARGPVQPEVKVSSTQDLILELLAEHDTDWLSIREIVSLLSANHPDSFRPKRVRESMRGLWNNRLVLRQIEVTKSGFRVFVYRKA